MREDKLGDLSMELSVEILQLTKELRANGHAPSVIWRETVEMFTDLWDNEIKILASINTAKGDKQ